MNDLPFRWCFFHNDVECPHEDDTPVHCFDIEIDESEDYSKCDVRDATVSPKEES